MRRDGRSLRLGWQQTILLLWLAVTIAMVAVALVLNRGSGNGPCPEAWAAAVCTGQAPAHSPRPTAHHTVAGQVLLTDAIIWLTPTRRTVHEGRGDPNRLGRGQGLRRGALPHPGLCELLPAACRNGRRAPRRCRSSSATAGPSAIHLPHLGEIERRGPRRNLYEVTREIRPDWDLSAPGLRAAWDAGDHARHHPHRQADHTRGPTEALSDADRNTTVRSE